MRGRSNLDKRAAKLALALGLTVVFWPAAAQAFECKLSEQYDYISVHWDELRALPYGVRRPGSTQLDEATVSRAVEAAFAAWTQPSCSDLRFVPRGFVDASEKSVNQVVFVSEGWPAKHASAVALTRTIYGKEDGRISSAVIEVNEELFRFVDAERGCSSEHDLQAVLTHEVGHLLGLDHTTHFSFSPTDPTMAPVVGVCEADKRTLEPDDVAGVCFLYPSGEPPGLCKDIPAQDEPYVDNAALGCSASRGRVGHAPGAPAWGVAWLVAGLLLRWASAKALEGRGSPRA